MTDERARAATPLAARLIAAVAIRDADQVADILAECVDFPALAVVLADQATLPKKLPDGVPSSFTPEERRQHHAAYDRGERDALTVLGEREYQRERKRHREEDAAAPPANLTGGHWVNRGGIQVWVNDNEREAS